MCEILLHGSGCEKILRSPKLLYNMILSLFLNCNLCLTKYVRIVQGKGEKKGKVRERKGERKGKVRVWKGEGKER